MGRDLQYAMRSLRRSPLFAVTAIVSLALGIGANTAIFSIADQLLLRTLPVKAPNEIVLLEPAPRSAFIGGSLRGMGTFSYPTYTGLRDGNPGAFTGIAARYQDDVDVTDRGPSERAICELVSGNYFQVLGVSAAIGRTLTPQDDRIADAEPYVVLAYDYWRRRFGGDPSVLNRTIDINGHPMTIVGVAQRGFTGFNMMSPGDLFVPMMMKKAVTPTWDHLMRRDSTWLRVFARLKPGVTIEAANAGIAAPFHRTLELDLQLGRPRSFQERYLKNQLAIKPAARGFDREQESFAKPLYVLLAMVGVLLLIACVNVASLLVSRAGTRQKEIAVRLSLGAGRASLVRLMMAESGLIAAASGTLGLLMSFWFSGLLVRLMPLDNIEVAIRSTPDLRIVAFTAAVSLATALLFGFMPVFQATRMGVAATLKAEALSISAGKRQARLRKILVAAEVALSLLLLVGAGLFARSLHKLMSVDSGMKIGKVLAFTTDPELHKYTSERSARLFVDLQKRIAAIPGVISNSAAVERLLTNSNNISTVHVEGYRPHNDEDMNPGVNWVLPGFFTTLGVPLIAGRDFNEADTAGTPPVVIVNETFARRFVPQGSPVGLHLGWGDAGPMPIQIVGVVKDVRDLDLATPPRATVYGAALQDRAAGLTYYVHSSMEPKALVGPIRRELAQLDPSLAMLDIKTLGEWIDETHYVERIFAWLSAAFSVLATVLASIGLYGVTAFAVTRRTQEIGIRLALGAQRGNVLRMVMREVLWLSVAGVAVGIPLTLLLGRLVESQLFAMKGSDTMVSIAAALVIGAVSAIAGYLPARRAARIDPVRALRYE